MLSAYIGIYPEWNVKSSVTLICKLYLFIGIYPEWNVKIDNSKYGALKLEYWNISRMECKEGRRTYETKVVQIEIYPEWNVKGDRQCETLC